MSNFFLDSVGFLLHILFLSLGLGTMFVRSTDAVLQKDTFASVC